MRNRFQAVVAIVLLYFIAVGSASAAEKIFGPFIINDDYPDLIILNGEIDVSSALNFRRALDAAPNATVVALNSPGGNVQMGLLIADDIHQKKLTTYIPKGSGCYSACAYIFLAGAAREVEGELGVHQISSQSSDLVGAQLTISDIIDVLGRFDTPPEVMSVMFKTPPDDMHVFTAEEIVRYRLNKASASNNGVVQRDPAESAGGLVMGAPKVHSSTSEASLPPAQTSGRPDRLAIYTGLDLFGDDIRSARVADAAECAGQCGALRGQCKAFTFNINPTIKRGPNCFLKSGYGRVDGNRVAFSGMLLSGSEPDPATFTVGTIDPQDALFDDVDLPGGDLSNRPLEKATTPLQCRLACIDNSSCIAFTYVRRKSECWLKGSVGNPKSRQGMISGVKTPRSFSPATIIDLN
ncbi:PAN domain-containing protein [Rhizobium sp. PAMB 3182]